MEQPEGAAEELYSRATYVWSEEEYFKSMRHAHGITPQMTLGPTVTVLVSVGAVLASDVALWQLLSSDFESGMRGPAFVSTAVAAWWLWTQQFKTQRQQRDFRKNAAANLEVQRKFVSQGFVQATIEAGAEVKQENLGHLKWKDMDKISETSDGFLFYLRRKNFKTLFFWQPTSSFASPQDIEAFKQLAQANHVRFTKGRS